MTTHATTRPDGMLLRADKGELPNVSAKKMLERDENNRDADEAPAKVRARPGLGRSAWYV